MFLNPIQVTFSLGKIGKSTTPTLHSIYIHVNPQMTYCEIPNYYPYIVGNLQYRQMWTFSNIHFFLYFIFVKVIKVYSIIRVPVMTTFSTFTDVKLCQGFTMLHIVHFCHPKIHDTKSCQIRTKAVKFNGKI